MRRVYSHIFIYLFISQTLLTTDQIPEDDAKYYYKLVNDNSQNTYLKKSQIEECYKDASHDELVDCVFSLSIDDQKKVFKEFHSTKKRAFLRKLDHNQYHKFIAIYNEEEWQDLYNSLTEHEQSCWPKTVKEQIESLKECEKYAERYGNIIHGTVIIAHCFSPIPIYYAYAAFIAYKVIGEGKNPLIENHLIDLFNEYMHSKFEI